MKRLALIAGVILLVFGIAGFTGLLAIEMAYAAVYTAAGLLGIMMGLTHRRDLVPPRAPGRDLRDLGGF